MMNENTIDKMRMPNSNTISEVWASILQNPAQLIRRWNYKSAMFSSTMRSSIFLITYLQIASKEGNTKQGLSLALGAAGAQFAYRFLSAGIIGSLVQSFRRVEPAWKAMLMIMLMIPAISHLFEFLVQLGYGHLTGTLGHTDEAILRSICVSIISTLFNLFAMRRGVLLVGNDEDRKSLWGDIKTIPRLAFNFVAFVPLEIGKMIFRKQFGAALISLFCFGIFAEMMCWAVFDKPYWTYNKGQANWLTFWGTSGIVLMLFCVGLAILYLSRDSKAV